MMVLRLTEHFIRSGKEMEKPEYHFNPYQSHAGGFTLIELLVVLSIISILAGIAVPMYQNSIVRANEAILKEDLFQLRDAIDKYYADHGQYPPAILSLVDRKYIRSIPQDPFTGSDESWIVLASDDGVGVFDLHSGSEAVGRNGVVYSEW